jgi:hypothetical protein
MSEWWTYSFSDFLLFSPRTYYRLFELYNAEIWPAQIAALALGAAIAVLALHGGAGARRAMAAILAALWLFVAWAYHLERYATINWAAEYFAWGFAAEAALLLWLGAVRGRLAPCPPAHGAGRAGVGVFLFSLLVQPLLGPLLGRAWLQVELFGVAPDPTVAGTLGVALLARGRALWLLLALPLAWCAISGATAWAMSAPDAVLLPAEGLIALVLAAWKARARAPIPPAPSPARNRPERA